MEFPGASHLLGSLAALLSAFCWAISALLFAQISHSINAISLNFFKGLVAIACLLLLVIPISWNEITMSQWLFMSLSGLLGIAIGDTLYFLTLNRLGARLTLLMTTLIPIMSAFGAVVIYNESLTLLAVSGLALTLGSVFYVLWSKAERAHREVTTISSGLLIGLVFVSTEASAILLSKAAVMEMDSLLVTFIRQVVGVAGITIWLLYTKQFIDNCEQVIAQKKHVGRLIAAAVIGGFLGTWLSIYALKATFASAAVILNSTSPLFIIPLSIWLLKEKVPRSSLYGAFIAVTGVIIYFAQLK